VESVFGKEKDFLELLMGADHMCKDVGIKKLFDFLLFFEFV
jgi:hypothetical protein